MPSNRVEEGASMKMRHLSTLRYTLSGEPRVKFAEADVRILVDQYSYSKIARKMKANLDD